MDDTHTPGTSGALDDLVNDLISADPANAPVPAERLAAELARRLDASPTSESG